METNFIPRCSTKLKKEGFFLFQWTVFTLQQRSWKASGVNRPEKRGFGADVLAVTFARRQDVLVLICIGAETFDTESFSSESLLC